jgi:hypothetical protein
MTYTINTRTQEFLNAAYNRHRATWKCMLDAEEAIGRVVFETAFGSMWMSRMELSHEERKALKAFCCSATGHTEFSHINYGLVTGKGNMKAIGRKALEMGLF